VGLSLERRLPGKQRVRVYLLGGLAFAFAIWAVYGAGEKAVFLGLILLMLGTPF
jgi:APA family basic amino acid/polyamine antiporter